MPKLSYNGHDIDVRSGTWERVYYDKRRVASGWSMFGKTYTFLAQEGRESANYTVRLSATGKVTVVRNGVTIFSDHPDNPVQIVQGMANGVTVSIPIPGQKESKAKSKGGWGGMALLVLIALFATQTVPTKEKHNKAMHEAVANVLKRKDLAGLALILEEVKNQNASGSINYADIFGLTYEHGMIFSELKDPKSASSKDIIISWGLFNHAHVNEDKLADFLLRWWNGRAN